MLIILIDKCHAEKERSGHMILLTSYVKLLLPFNGFVHVGTYKHMDLPVSSFISHLLLLTVQGVNE